MSFKKVGVVGSGQMGSGIAQVVAMHKVPVVMMDVQPSALEKGRNTILANLERGIKKGTLSESDKSSAMSYLQSASSLEGLKDCDLVIEAATENVDLKQKIFKELDSICHPQAVLCTNTSSISITLIASSTQRPQLVAGLHFMNPVPVMKLVEGIRGLQTSPETFQRVRGFAEFLGKTFVEAKDFPGFVVNRVLMPMINEAVYTLFEGVASAEDIDHAMKLGTHHPMGPLALADFIGLDTCLAIMNVLHQGMADSKYRPCPLLVKYVEAGWLGKKTGRGFYSY